MNDADQTSSHLRTLREQAGLTVRQLGTSHPNILAWEKAGRVAKTEVLLPVAAALGVTVEEVLGQPRPRKTITAGGRMGQLFEAARKLPRSQQSKIIAVLEPFVERHEREAASH